MEKHIRQRWDDDKLQRIANRFGTSLSEITILDSFESFIYEYEREDNGYILRVSLSQILCLVSNSREQDPSNETPPPKPMISSISRSR